MGENQFDQPDSFSEAEQRVALDLFKFYDRTAGVTKGRTWTMAAWVLSVNSALIAFAFSPDTTQVSSTAVQLAACFAGALLSAFLVMVLLGQGGHLQLYWAFQDQAAARHPILAPFSGPTPDTSRISQILRVFPSQRKRQAETERPFPNFCGNLMVLAFLYLFAFLASAAYVAL